MSTAQRTLRRKGDRALLWYDAGGRCSRCGEELGADWQADHVVPWSVCQRTVVEEMQALCRRCNREKGTQMLRGHQARFEALCREIMAGRPVRRIYGSVVPGGGKSWHPPIAAHYLIPACADAICWVAPRVSLQEQAEGNFLDPALRRLLGHRHEVRGSTNDYDPCRNLSGYVTTYHALVADLARKKVNVREFDRKRYILFLDEPHHCWQGGEWHQAVSPLVERAALTVFMSGTWERHDGRPVAYLPYEYIGGNKLRSTLPDLGTDADTPHISYSRTEALRDHAIIPLHFQSFDGPAQWLDRVGLEQTIPSLATVEKPLAPDALYTALRTEFAMQLLARAAGDWKAYRSRRRSGKFLVAAPSISLARMYKKRLEEMGITEAAIATSDDSDAAVAALRRFRKPCGEAGAIDVLVTVQMAYEGLDAEAITHIACLTGIRSWPWIEQLFSRGDRVDKHGGPYEEQWCRIYCPDDPLMAECIAKIKAEQDAVARVPPTGPKPPGPGNDDTKELPGTVAPIAGQVARERTFDLETGQAIDHEENELLQASIRENGQDGLLDAITLKRLMETYNARKSGQAPVPEEPLCVLATPASVREHNLRTRLREYVATYENRAGIPFGTLNSRILSVFKVERDNMTEAQLGRLWAWLQENYPLPA